MDWKIVATAIMVAGAIAIGGLALGLYLRSPAEAASLTPVSGQCWTGGCARAVV